MSIIVRPTKTPNVVAIPRKTLFDVKAELERQHIKFVAKYLSTQIIHKFGAVQFQKFLHELDEFVPEYDRWPCLVIEAYGNAEDLCKLAMSFYVAPPKPASKPIVELTPYEYAIRELNLFYELQLCFEDSVIKRKPHEEIKEEADMLLHIKDGLNQKLDAAINSNVEEHLKQMLKEEKEKVNQYFNDIENYHI